MSARLDCIVGGKPSLGSSLTGCASALDFGSMNFRMVGVTSSRLLGLLSSEGGARDQSFVAGSCVVFETSRRSTYWSDAGAWDAQDEPSRVPDNASAP